MPCGQSNSIRSCRSGRTGQAGYSASNISARQPPSARISKRLSPEESRADFIHKCGIAQKEASESLYWLRLLAASGILPADRLASIMRETEELIAVIAAIIVKAKSKGNK